MKQIWSLQKDIHLIGNWSTVKSEECDPGLHSIVHPESVPRPQLGTKPFRLGPAFVPSVMMLLKVKALLTTVATLCMCLVMLTCNQWLADVILFNYITSEFRLYCRHRATTTCRHKVCTKTGTCQTCKCHGKHKCK